MVVKNRYTSYNMVHGTVKLLSELAEELALTQILSCVIIKDMSKNWFYEMNICRTNPDSGVVCAHLSIDQAGKNVISPSQFFMLI